MNPNKNTADQSEVACQGAPAPPRAAHDDWRICWWATVSTAMYRESLLTHQGAGRWPLSLQPSYNTLRRLLRCGADQEVTVDGSKKAYFEYQAPCHPHSSGRTGGVCRCPLYSGSVIAQAA